MIHIGLAATPEQPDSGVTISVSSSEAEHARLALNRFLGPVTVNAADGQEAVELRVEVIRLGRPTIGR